MKASRKLGSRCTGFWAPKLQQRWGPGMCESCIIAGKIVQVLKEFDCYQLDILGINEMRWAGSGKFCSEGKTRIYSGHEEHYVHGVGMVLGEEAIKVLVGWKSVNERIITARFQSRHENHDCTSVHSNRRY